MCAISKQILISYPILVIYSLNYLNLYDMQRSGCQNYRAHIMKIQKSF